MADTLSTQIFGSVSWSWVETYTDLGTITDRSKVPARGISSGVRRGRSMHRRATHMI